MAFLFFLRENRRWLAAGVALTFASSFGQTFFISIFAADIMAAFAITDGQWGLFYTLGTLASAALMLWAGVLTDRLRVRLLGAVSLGLLSLACLSMAVLPALWLLPLVIFALRFCGQGMLGHVANVGIARWFVATRGRALAVSALGVGLGEAFLPMIFVALNAVLDWRLLWMLTALVPLALIPLVVGLLRIERTPQALATEAGSSGLGGRHWTRGEVLRHWLFWMVFPALIAPGMFATMLFFQQVHLTQVKGWDHVGFVALFPIFTAGGAVSMIATGFIVDRWGTRRLMPLYLLPLAIGFALFWGADSLAGAAIGFLVLGLTQGAVGTIVSVFLADHFGTRNLGAIKSVSVAIMVLGTALGPGITGLLIDAGVDFVRQMPAIVAYVLLACALNGWAMRRSQPLLESGPAAA